MNEIKKMILFFKIKQGLSKFAEEKCRNWPREDLWFKYLTKYLHTYSAPKSKVHLNAKTAQEHVEVTDEIKEVC